MKLLARYATAQIPDTASEAVEMEALAFLSAGGVVTLDDWRDLDPIERAALVKARRTLEVDRAFLSGTAASGRDGLERIYELLDGGSSRRRSLLDAAASGALARMAERPVEFWK